jgi:hypothetical protein
VDLIHLPQVRDQKFAPVNVVKNKGNLLTSGVNTSLSKRTSLHRVIELVTKYIICIKMAFMLFYSPVIS